MDGRQQEVIHMPCDSNCNIYLQLEYKLIRCAAELLRACRTKGHGSVRLNGRRLSQANVVESICNVETPGNLTQQTVSCWKSVLENLRGLGVVQLERTSPFLLERLTILLKLLGKHEELVPSLTAILLLRHTFEAFFPKSVARPPFGQLHLRS